MKISLFIPCLVDQFQPQVGMAVKNILERAGQEVIYCEKQTCCGQPAFNSGYREETAVLAEKFLRDFNDAEVIVAPSGSCVSMVKEFYSHLPLSESLKRKHDDLKNRIYEFSEFLVNILKVDNIGAEFNHSVTYHDSCHLLRELGIEEEPRKLLKNVKGLEFIEMENSNQCCGFGGTFSMKYPDISTEMVKSKVNSIVDSGAEYVVGADTGCLMHIQGYADRNEIPLKTIHLAEVLGGCSR